MTKNLTPFRQLLGLRTLKTAIAVTLGVVIAQLLGLQYPFYVGMTAIIAMERTLQRSVYMGKIRVVGSAVGAATGAVMSYLHRGSPLLIFLGILLVIVICNKLKLQPAVAISGITFLWIMVHVGDASPLFYGAHRVFDSFVGASVSCLVNLLFLPYYNIGRLARGTQHSCDTVVGIIERPDGVVDSTELADIRASLRELDTLMELYRGEYLTREKRTQVERYDRLYRGLLGLMTELEELARAETATLVDPALRCAGRDYHRAALAAQLEQVRALSLSQQAATSL